MNEERSTTNWPLTVRLGGSRSCSVASPGVGAQPPGLLCRVKLKSLHPSRGAGDRSYTPQGFREKKPGPRHHYPRFCGSDRRIVQILVSYSGLSAVSALRMDEYLDNYRYLFGTSNTWLHAPLTLLSLTREWREKELRCFLTLHHFSKTKAQHLTQDHEEEPYGEPTVCRPKRGARLVTK